MGAAHPRHAEHDHNVSFAKVDSITVSSIPPSVDVSYPTSSAPAQQDRASTSVCTHLRIDGAATNLE